MESKADRTRWCSSTTGARTLRVAFSKRPLNCDRRIRVVVLSRNFGHQAALGAALDFATGDAVVLMDADLQDQPEVIPEFVRQYQGGRRRGVCPEVDARRAAGCLRTALPAVLSDHLRAVGHAAAARQRRFRAAQRACRGRAPPATRARAVPARPACVGRLPSGRYRCRSQSAIRRPAEIHDLEAA